jgi:hypothetical protein
VALAYRPDDATVGPEPVDLVGLATRSVQGIGLLFSIQLAPITSGFDSLTHKEAQP